MSEWNVLLLIPLWICSVYVGVYIGRAVVRHWTRRDRFVPLATEMLKTPRSPMQLYCQSCGKALVTVQIQSGFDGKTGKPVFTTWRSCPDRSNSDPISTPDCINRPNVKSTIVNHRGHKEEEISPQCATCVDSMVRDHVITEQKARELYAEMGVTDNYVPEPGLYSSVYGLSSPSIFKP